MLQPNETAETYPQEINGQSRLLTYPTSAAPLGLLHRGHEVTIEGRPAEVCRQDYENARTLVKWHDVKKPAPAAERFGLYTAASMAEPKTTKNGNPTTYAGRRIICPDAVTFGDLFSAMNDAKGQHIAFKTPVINGQAEAHPGPAGPYTVPVGPYLRIDGHNQTRGLYATPNAATVAAVQRAALAVQYDSFSFQTNDTDDANTPRPVWLNHNLITGNYVLAVLEDQPPVLAISIWHKVKPVCFCWFGGHSSTVHILRDGLEVGVWTIGDSAGDYPNAEEVGISIQSAIDSGHWLTLVEK